jgi:hypothetical protein
LKDFEVERRQATLVAILLDTQSTLIDEILDLHDRMVGSAFAKAKRAYETSFQEAGKAINEKVRLYAQVGQALIEAKDGGSDPFEAIERVISWGQFTQSVQKAEKLARPEDFDYLGLLSNHYSQLRRYMPAFLEAFEFEATPGAQNIIEAVDVLKKLPAAKARSIPDDAPIEFVRRRWPPHVFTDSGLDRRYYELCAVTELKNALRSGDIWVPGSRQFKDFEDYLLPQLPSKHCSAPTACRLLPPEISIGIGQSERRSCAMNCKKSMDSPSATNCLTPILSMVSSK